MVAPEILQIHLTRAYPSKIFIQEGGVQRAGEIIQELVPIRQESQFCIVTDHTLSRLYAPAIHTSFNRVIPEIRFHPGERAKTLTHAIKAYQALLAMNHKRRDILIGLGGGSICDLCGFVASTYMRGVQYCLLPTSIVAQIDAAIGGKVAVNLRQAKNILGSFHHPINVLIDPSTISTLPQKEIRNGLAEMIKTAVIGSADLFAFIERFWPSLLNKNIEIFHQALVETIKIKLAVLNKDPFEDNLKRELNFGHTLAHALETIRDYQKITHGEAVSIGMAVATRMANQKGICSDQTSNRILNLLKIIGLPIEWPKGIDDRQLKKALETIASIRNGHLYFVLPKTIGHAIIDESITIPNVLQGTARTSRERTSL